MDSPFLKALYQPIWTSAINSAASLALAFIWKIAPWTFVLIGAVIGGIFF